MQSLCGFCAAWLCLLPAALSLHSPSRAFHAKTSLPAKLVVPIAADGSPGSALIDDVRGKQHVPAYSELQSGSCTSVSKDMCGAIATRRGMPVYLENNNAFNPPGCFIKDHPHKMLFNSATTTRQCSTTKSCVCQADSYVLGRSETNKCPSGSARLSTKKACKDAAKSLNLKWQKTVKLQKKPKGCYKFKGKVWFNTHPKGKKKSKHKPICQKVPERAEADADPSSTHWADEAYNIAGKQADYDRVMGVDSSKREAEYNDIVKETKAAEQEAHAAESQPARAAAQVPPTVAHADAPVSADPWFPQCADTGRSEPDTSGAGACPCAPEACEKTSACLQAHYDVLEGDAKQACDNVKNANGGGGASLDDELCCQFFLAACQVLQPDCYYNMTNFISWYDSSSEIWHNVIGMWFPKSGRPTDASEDSTPSGFNQVQQNSTDLLMEAGAKWKSADASTVNAVVRRSSHQGKDIRKGEERSLSQMKMDTSLSAKCGD